MTQRIELSFIWLQFLNLERFKELIFPTPRIELLLNNMTQRIFSDMTFFRKNSKNWTFFTDMSHRIEPILQDSKTWELFFTWLKDFFFLEHDSQNWTFLLRIWLIEIEPFFSTWVKENDSFFKHDSENISILQIFLTQRTMILSLEILTQRIDYCEQKYDSKKWTLFLKTLTN